MSESRPLLSKQETAVDVRRSWRHYVLFLIMLVYYFARSMMSYIINEWTQSTIKEDLIGNGTLHKHISACESNHTGEEYKSYLQVQKESARWQMYYETTSLVVAFVSNLLLPSMTDMYGRKFLIYLSLFGGILKASGVLVTIYFKLDYIYIIVAYALEGVTGASSSFFTASLAFFADITPLKRDRTLAITAVEGILVLCVTLSALSVGLCIKYFGFLYPSIAVVGLVGICLLLAIVLPETLPNEKRRSKVSVWRGFQRVTEFYISKEFKGKRCSYTLLILAFGFRYMSNSHRSTLDTTYQLGPPLCWSADLIGYYSAVRHAGESIIGIGSLRPLQKCFSDEVIALFALLSSSGSFVLEAFATTTALMFMVSVTTIFTFLVVPLIRSMLSVITPADRQGALFAGFALVELAGGTAATLMDNSIYAASIDFMKGFVFLVLAAVNLVAFILLACFTSMRKKINTSVTVNATD